MSIGGSQHTADAVGDLRAAVEAAAAEVRGERPTAAAAPTLERPKRAGFGDFSTNAAMLLAPVLGNPPRAIAERLGERLAERLGDGLERHEVAGPGFVNLFLSDAWHRRALAGVLDAGERFGAGALERPVRTNVEFVSANPTGPLHVGHSRNAAYGDALARILAFRGYDVDREFYVNDFGSQVRRLGESIQARARGEEVPEGGYNGDYVVDLAADIPGAATRDVDEVARDGVERMLEHMRRSLEAFGVRFDTFSHERDLHEGDPSPVQHAFDVLAEQGRTYRHEGALWLRTTAFGDDKDRVLERSNGEHTYLASDIAYHQDKRERGYELLVDVWGADHHGYVRREKAAFEALGGRPEDLDLLLMQFVHLVRRDASTGRGERASMSKRSGEFVTFDDLVAEIGVDAARWFLLQRSHDTTIDLDLDLAREQSNENPVYYVQYAHARVASMLAKAGEDRVAAALAGPAPEGLPPLEPPERTLLLKLLAFPGEVAEAAERRAPHRMAAYALELAQDFTAFYRDCRVVGAEPEAVETFRLALSSATQRTIAGALGLLGVSAPASM